MQISVTENQEKFWGFLNKLESDILWPNLNNN